jgi:23S rRNA (guanine745-N1)-methyltransferase
VILPPLACTVRGCGRPLARRDRTLACPSGHTYDVARTGYVNLLQPQDRRSLHAGDSREAVEARARLAAAGVGRALIDAVVSRLAGLELGKHPIAADLGSGTGEALAALARVRSLQGVGIDLSVAAADHAARRFPDLTWVVANADRRLPLLDGSVNLVLSLHARRNPAECARVLAPGGLLLMAVPAADDLIELRERVLGSRVERERAQALVDEHAASFDVVDEFQARSTARLDGEALRLLLRVTYRGARAAAAERVSTLPASNVTLASDLVLFRLRNRSVPGRGKEHDERPASTRPMPAGASSRVRAERGRGHTKSRSRRAGKP